MYVNVDLEYIVCTYILKNINTILKWKKVHLDAYFKYNKDKSYI